MDRASNRLAELDASHEDLIATLDARVKAGQLTEDIRREVLLAFARTIKTEYGLLFSTEAERIRVYETALSNMYDCLRSLDMPKNK